jgi:hypothetical protein
LHFTALQDWPDNSACSTFYKLERTGDCYNEIVQTDKKEKHTGAQAYLNEPDSPNPKRANQYETTG